MGLCNHALEFGKSRRFCDSDIVSHDGFPKTVRSLEG